MHPARLNLINRQSIIIEHIFNRVQFEVFKYDKPAVYVEMNKDETIEFIRLLNIRLEKIS